MTTRKIEQPAVVGRCPRCNEIMQEAFAVCRERNGVRENVLLCKYCFSNVIGWREAAADNGMRESHAGPRSSAAHGWPSLRWSAEEPKRRGWWWLRATPTAEAKIVEVYPNLDGELITKGGATFKWMKSLWPEMRWAGPLVEPVETPDAETTANGELKGGTGDAATPRD